MAMIEFENVSKQYTIRTAGYGTIRDRFRSLLQFGDRSNHRREFWSLNDVSFAVKEGETVGVVGPNGAGKSTILKLVARVITPSAGRVRVFGKVQGFIELGAGFHQELTGRENIHLYGSIVGMKGREIRAKFDRIVDFAGIEPFIDTPLKRYSSGMIVRLGFAVAIHMEPEILLVDEVLAVGDAAFQQKCIDRIDNFRSEGRTMLVVSHNRHQIERLCDRVLFVHGGRLIYDGPTADALDSYYATIAPRIRTGATSALGPIFITGVELLGTNGRGEQTFRPMDKARLRISFRTTERVERPVFYAQIYRGLDLVHGSNTARFGLAPVYEDGHEGTVEVEYRSLPLLQGRYSISVGILRGPHTTEHYDTREHVIDFAVESEFRDGGGLVYHDHRWHVGARQRQ